MASADDFDLPENDDDESRDGGSGDDAKGLRKQLKQALARIKEQDEQIAASQKESRAKSIAEAFEGAGINSKYAKFYDGEDVTVEAVKAWGLENDFIAAASDDAPPAGEPNVPDPQIVAAQRIQQAVATGAAPPTDLAALIANAGSFEELVKSGVIKFV